MSDVTANGGRHKKTMKEKTKEDSFTSAGLKRETKALLLKIENMWDSFDESLHRLMNYHLKVREAKQEGSE